MAAIGAAIGQYAMSKIEQSSANSAAKKAQKNQFLQDLWMQQNQINWERERATNAHQWEMEDLKKAGLNPALTATGGSGANTGGISAPTSAMAESQGLQMGNFTDLIGKVVEMKNNTKATNASSNLADAQALKTLTENKYIPQNVRNETMQAIAAKISANANATNAVTNKKLSKTQEYLNYATANNQNWSAENNAQKTRYQMKENRWYEKNHFREGMY